MRKIIHLYDLLFPPTCVVCTSSSQMNSRLICNSCLSKIDRPKGIHCQCCGVSLDVSTDAESPKCGACLKKQPPFDSVFSLFLYETVVRDLLINIKFKGDTPSISALKELLIGEDISRFNDCDLIIPVPLHRKRLQERGFNQALLLARMLFSDRLYQINPFLLKRVKMTKAQTGLSGVERRKNLKNSFSVKSHTELSGRNICLVDDVYTTGTTVAECSRVLKACGCSQVKVLTVARVAKPH